MIKRMSIASAVLTALSALLALLLVTSPAYAHHKADHEQGKADRSTSESDHDGDADSEDGATTEADDGDADDATDPNEDDGDNAHPSGKDRSVENGGSGNQGKSESNPDDSKGPMRYEGELGDDKPGGPGGTDLSDQDGNNGCGNDDDFDDDNNGWCGKPEEPTTVPPVVGGTDTETPPVPPAVIGDEVEEDTDVLGGIIQADEVDADEPAAVAAARPAASGGAALPFTGTSVVWFLVIAMGLLGVGFALLRTRRG